MKSTLIVLLAGACMAATVPVSASARGRHYLTVHHRHVDRYRYDPGFRNEVLGTTPMGDTVLSGRIGFHRSDFGVMVPDSQGETFAGKNYCSDCPLPF